jgi:PIN domain nuclease of toxin-antitoxin system
LAITLDTHTLVWYLDKDLNQKLSLKALQTIKNAEESEIIFIPIIVLIELLYLIEKGRVNLSFTKILTMLESNQNYQIIPLDIELVKIAETIKSLEMHDRLIMAVAKKTMTKLVSKDRQLHKQKLEVIW